MEYPFVIDMRIAIAVSVAGLAILAANASDVHAQQRSTGGNRPASRPGNSSRAQPGTPPTPVAPNMNPIQPIIRYEGWGTPTVVIQSNVPGRTTSGAPVPVPERKGREPVVVIGGGGYLSPDYYGQAYTVQPYATPASPSGPLPGGYAPPPVSAPAPLPIEPAPPVDSNPNRIITPPRPERTVEPPALGTSRAEVLGRYGQPWGSLRAGAKETLYFSGGLVVVIEDGKVSAVR
jgi:hypothetical protein